MGRRKDISNATRREIVNQTRNGVTNFSISHLFDCSVRTVQNGHISLAVNLYYWYHNLMLIVLHVKSNEIFLSQFGFHC